jgi:hypothetical protein
MMFHPSLERVHVVLGACIDLEIIPRPSTCEDQTGGVVWPVNNIMARVIKDLPVLLHGKRVIELGAGTGVLSIAAAASGAEVTATDLPDFTSTLQSNVDRNAPLLAAAAATNGCGSVRVMGHRWGEAIADLGGPFDVVLCCELLYWGGWSLLADDTRAPLLLSLSNLTRAGPARASGGSDPSGSAVLEPCARGAAGGAGMVLMGFAVRNAAREREFFAAAAEAFAVRYCHCPFGSEGAGSERSARAGWIHGAEGPLPALEDTLPEDLEDGDVIVAVMSRRIRAH